MLATIPGLKDSCSKIFVGNFGFENNQVSLL